MWSLTYSKSDIEYLRAKGAAVLDDEVRPENLWAWNAFQTLRGSRRYGMSVGPIPISEVHAYCDMVGLTDVVDRMRLVRFIAALDGAERNHGNT